MCLQRISAGLCPLNRQIEDGLSVLGDAGAETAFFYLKGLGLTREMVPFQRDSFDRGLKSVFGQGSEILQAGVIKSVRRLLSSSSCEARCYRCAMYWLGETEGWEAGVVKMSMERALDVAGQLGKETFFDVIRSRYGVTRDDIFDMPGRFMTALKLVFDGSARPIELGALDEIQYKLGITARSLEEAVSLLKSKIERGDRTEAIPAGGAYLRRASWASSGST